MSEAFSSGGRIRPQDRGVVLRMIASRSHTGAMAVWQFVKDNWCVTLFGGSQNKMERRRGGKRESVCVCE